MSERDELINLLHDLETTVHPGSPRAMSVRIAHAEVPDAVDAFLTWLNDRTPR